MEKDRLLHEAEAAKYLSVSKYTLRNWRHKLKGPRFLKLGGHVIRYRLSDLEKFLEESSFMRWERDK